MKQIRRGLMSPCALRKMIQKFETTGQLGILPGRGRKQISFSSFEDVATESLKPAVSRRIDSVTVSVVTHPWDILWSDEPHFCLYGHINIHNCRIWAEENPHAIQEQPLHPDKVTACCGFTAAFTIGPYFFEEITANGIKTCSAIGQRCRDMLRDFVIPRLQQRSCLQDIIFMQDGLPHHIDRRVKQLLRQHFTDARVISRHFPTAWPPCSPDVTPATFGCAVS
ncbi:hypothetical protein AVEN_261426-1 [Araneus ventricosus]|uniref:DUF4817 domain-containing protein n=1 Tax=Araneus ventricosus TaxID=182803 RepID=A0A4Y2GW92_ARAVE|nr:hypothetical protein AVEN_261426-1 [Araneus ventricosus]